jgi:uncharacterized protein (DUF2235 family)
MGQNIIVCLDGTNNQFGDVNTNVVRLIQVPHRDTANSASITVRASRPGSERNLRRHRACFRRRTWKVQEAYSYLMEMWEPDDRVFIFGFSRGAYSARVLAGVLHAFGLLPRCAQNMLP